MAIEDHITRDIGSFNTAGNDAYIRVFGKIESVLDANYQNGQLTRTRFVMQMFDCRNQTWSNVRKWLPFYGSIPAEFMGQEAMYSRTNDTNDDLGRISQITADIYVGKIKARRDGKDGVYDIDDTSPVSLPPHIPRTITSVQLFRVHDAIIAPYTHVEKPLRNAEAKNDTLRQRFIKVLTDS